MYQDGEYWKLIYKRIGECQRFFMENDYDAKLFEASSDTPMPVLMVGVEADHLDRDRVLSVSVVPSGAAEDEVLLLQFYMMLPTDIPLGLIQEAERFIIAANSKFMLGNLLIYDAHLCLKYGMVFPNEKMLVDGTLLGAFRIFLRQADVFGEIIERLCNSEITLGEAVALATE